VNGPIRPRLSEKGEKVTLLDEKEVTLDANTLVISDDSGVIGLAGLMGGLSTAVSEKTTDVFFEAAFWPQDFVAGRARSYGLHTDASLRFERGVDPQGQGRAVERATSLLLEISGGDAGPLVLQTADDHLPVRETILLRRSRLEILLGVKIADETVTDILQRLGLAVAASDEGWSVTAPSFRFDIAVEVDLIEEIARIYGYDAIPETTAIAETPLEAVTESQIELEQVAATLVARDYQEIVGYSLTAAAANASRQQDRIRLFEFGKSFHGTLEEHIEVVRIAGLAMGSTLPEQWGVKSQSVDFFDIKSDVSALLRLAGDASDIKFVATEHPALQPGQTANILRNESLIGTVGKLHPRHAKAFDIKRDVFLFELDAMVALGSAVPEASPISKYPSIRRDIAVIVDDKISSDELVSAVASVAPDLISTVRIFDIYKGPGIEAGLKSVALGLILQETSRTLTDDDADAVMTAAVRKLEEKFAAELRD